MKDVDLDRLPGKGRVLRNAERPVWQQLGGTEVSSLKLALFPQAVFPLGSLQL